MLFRSLNMMKNSGNEFLEKTANIPGYHAVRHATAFVILSAPGGNEPMGFNMANVSCAAENIQLAATELGIGSRFMMGPIMAFTQEPVKSKLDLPEDYQPLVAVALGYVDGEFSERTKEMDKDLIERILNDKLEDYGYAIQRFMEDVRELYAEDTTNHIMEKRFGARKVG